MVARARIAAQPLPQNHEKKMPRVPEDVIEQILNQVDIVSLIGNYFPLQKIGANYRALCPFHNEKTPSFTVNPIRRSFHCFGCGKGGTAIRFVMEHEGLSFIDALKKLGDIAGVEVVVAEPTMEELEQTSTRQRLTHMHQETAKLFHRLLMRDRARGERAREYLKSRGISAETAKEWLLGYAPDDRGLFLHWANDMKFSPDDLVKGGLCGSGDRGIYPRFRDRLMFPVRNDYGDVIAFSGRLLDSEAAAAKYLNSPETPIFTKSKVLFGMHQARKPILSDGYAAVFEGQLDLIQAWQRGIGNVVAPLGTAFTDLHARMLKRYTKEVMLVFDGDSAGYKAAVRTFGTLCEAGLFVRALDLPSGEDPDSLLKKEGVEKFSERMKSAPDFFDYQITCESRGRDLQSPRDQRDFAEAMAATVCLIRDAFMRDSVISKVATRLGLAPDHFERMVVRAGRRRQYRSDRSRFEETQELSAAKPFSIANPEITMLCQMALTDGVAKAWLGKPQNRDFLRTVPESELLIKIVTDPFNPHDDVETARFLTNLGRGREEFLSGLLTTAMPANNDRACMELLEILNNKLVKQEVARRIAKLKEPGLSPEKAWKIQQETIELEEKAADAFRSDPENGEGGDPF